jgi:hypothetical protein
MVWIFISINIIYFQVRGILNAAKREGMVQQARIVGYLNTPRQNIALEF